MKKVRAKKTSKAGGGLLIAVLVLIVLLVLLLRLAEFTGHPMRRPRPRITPASRELNRPANAP